MSTFILKLIACIAMLADHIGWFSYTGYEDLGNILRAFGRISFPIFAYLIAFGFTKTHSKYHYLLRLIVVGFISELPYNYCFHNLPSKFSIATGQDIGLQILKSLSSFNNVYFTLALGLLSIILYDVIIQKSNHLKLIALLPAALLSITANIIGTDYGAYGALLIFLFYIAQSNKILIASICAVFSCRQILQYYLILLLNPNNISNQLGSWSIMQLFAAGAIIPILCCNGSHGVAPKSKLSKICVKYAFYLFYPIHILILSIIFK